VRKLTYNVAFDPAADTNGGTAYNTSAIWFNPNTDLTDELKALSLVYEEYLPHRMEIFATLGKGYTADNKFKQQLFSRVDTGAASGTLLASYFSIISGQNTTLHTFEQRTRVKIADVRPKFLGYGTPTSYQAMLPNSMQWYQLDPSYFTQQLFRGVTVASAIPDETYSPGKLSIVFTVSVTFKFRGRVIDAKAYSSTIAHTIRSAHPLTGKQPEDDEWERDTYVAVEALSESASALALDGNHTDSE
jgi:hypothetical protein